MNKASAILIVLLSAGVPLAAQDHPAGARIPVKDGEALRVDGPFTHDNLSIYILFRKEMPAAQAQYITLEEGIRSGLVTVTEAPRAQVQQLLITNSSDRRLFLQIGELVHGGRQDRTLQTSLVIPPKTTDAPIPSFCVEQTRWSGGKEFAAEGKIAPKGVQMAISARSQDGVWRSVEGYKRQARAAMKEAPDSSRTSSINEELSSREFRKLTGEYESALGRAPGRYSFPVGVVCAVNGEISTADLYHAGGLFKSLFFKLLSSAATEAAANPAGGVKKFTPPTLREVSDFLAGAWDGQRQEERLGLGNVSVRITSSRAYNNELYFENEWIHSHVMKKETGIIVPVPPPRPIPVPIPRPPMPPRPMSEPMPRDP